MIYHCLSYNYPINSCNCKYDKNMFKIMFGPFITRESIWKKHAFKHKNKLYPEHFWYIEIVILNIIILLGLLISYFPFRETGTILVVLYIIVLIEALVIPTILPIDVWHREYFNHLYILLAVVVVNVLVYIKTEINPLVQFLGYAGVLYTLAYISSIRILTNKDW